MARPSTQGWHDSLDYYQKAEVCRPAARRASHPGQLQGQLEAETICSSRAGRPKEASRPTWLRLVNPGPQQLGVWLRAPEGEHSGRLRGFGKVASPCLLLHLKPFYVGTRSWDPHPRRGFVCTLSSRIQTRDLKICPPTRSPLRVKGGVINSCLGSAGVNRNCLRPAGMPVTLITRNGEGRACDSLNEPH